MNEEAYRLSTKDQRLLYLVTQSDSPSVGYQVGAMTNFPRPTPRKSRIGPRWLLASGISLAFFTLCELGDTLGYQQVLSE